MTLGLLANVALKTKKIFETSLVICHYFRSYEAVLADGNKRRSGIHALLKAWIRASLS